MKQYSITPVSKPRMTKSVKWKQNAHQKRYFAFKKEVERLGVEVPECGYHLVFVLPMPVAKSWPEERLALVDGTKHQRIPDKDNLEKALLDCVHKNDAHIWNEEKKKRRGI